MGNTHPPAHPHRWPRGPATTILLLVLFAGVQAQSTKSVGEDFERFEAFEAVTGTDHDYAFDSSGNIAVVTGNSVLGEEGDDRQLRVRDGFAEFTLDPLTPLTADGVTFDINFGDVTQVGDSVDTQRGVCFKVFYSTPSHSHKDACSDDDNNAGNRMALNGLVLSQSGNGVLQVVFASSCHSSVCGANQNFKETQNIGLTAQSDTWYRFTVTWQNSPDIIIQEHTTGFLEGFEAINTGDTRSECFDSEHSVFSKDCDRFIVSSGGTGTAREVQVDNVELGTVSVPVTGVPAVASVPVDSLVGFAVDSTGSTILTRQVGRAEVVAYDGSTLDELGSDGEKFCNQQRGVATYVDTIFYVKCSGIDVDIISVRNRFFGAAPGSGGLCNSDYDETDDGWGNQVELPDDLYDLHTLDFYFETTDGVNACTSAWTYSRTDGRVGLVILTRNNGPVNDEWAIVDRTFSSQAPDATCFWRTPEGDDIMGAVSELGGTSFYEVRADVVYDHKLFKWVPQGTMDRVYHSAGTLGNSRGLDCAAHIAAVQGSDGVVRVVQIAQGEEAVGTILHTFQGEPVQGGVALSVDGKWLAYHAQPGVWDIACISSCPEGVEAGQPRASILAPAGNFRAVKLDTTGTAAWIATDQNIERFVIQEFTCNTECVHVEVDGAGRLPSDSTGGSGASGGSGQRASGSVLAQLKGGWSDATKVVVSLLFIAVIAGIAYWLAGPAPMVVGGAGTLAMGAAVPMFGFPLWIPITVAAGGLGTFAAGIARQVGGKK